MAKTGPQIEISRLRVGLFVHLDLGWFAHPFPLSSFKIESEDQLRTIRGLGLKTIRWDPDRSDPEFEAGGLLPGGDRALPGMAAEDAAAAGQVGAEESAAEREIRARRDQLEQQREETRRTEAQYGEAGAACTQALALVKLDPTAAKAQTEALTHALLDKMLGEGDLCIRVLNAGAGDKATAHAMNVTVIALLLGRAIGLDETELLHLGLGALMHDMGKADLPERVRHPDEASSAAELQAYRQHVEFGVAHAQRMGMPAAAMRIVAQHHEMVDGSGFPLAAAGDRISLPARIVALVNRFDNLCNPSVLTRALTPHEAVSMIFAQGRAKFDGGLLNTFIRMMGVYPAGSVVQLTDDRYAIVVGVNSTRPLKPRVLVHDPKVPADEALVVDLERFPDLGIRRSLRAAQLPPPALQYLAPRPRLTYFFEPGAMTAADAADQAVLGTETAGALA